MAIPPAILGALLVPVFALLLRRWRRSRDRDEAEPGTDRGEEPRRRGGRRRQFGVGDLVLVVVGLGCIVGGYYGARDTLDIAQPPRSSGALGVVPPDVRPRDHSFAASMGVRVEDCKKDVEVKLVLSGTAEWWARHARRMGEVERLHVAVPPGKLTDVRAWLTTDGTEGFLRPLTQRWRQRLKTSGKRGVPPQLTLETSRPDHKRFTRLSVSVRDWGRILAPVVLRFKADWTRNRAVGSCFVTIPSLTGGQSVLAAQDLNGNADDREMFSAGEVVVGPGGLSAADDPSLEPPRGLATVDPSKHRLDDDSSAPEPEAQLYGLPTWTCARRPPGGLDIVEDATTVPDFLTARAGESATVLSSRHMQRWLGAGDCSVVAVLEERGGSQGRDVRLLAFGALLSLGVTILLELLLDWRQRRRSAAAVG